MAMQVKQMVMALNILSQEVQFLSNQNRVILMLSLEIAFLNTILLNNMEGLYI